MQIRHPVGEISEICQLINPLHQKYKKSSKSGSNENLDLSNSMLQQGTKSRYLIIIVTQHNVKQLVTSIGNIYNLIYIDVTNVF